MTDIDDLDLQLETSGCTIGQMRTKWNFLVEKHFDKVPFWQLEQLEVETLF